MRRNSSPLLEAPCCLLRHERSVCVRVPMWRSFEHRPRCARTAGGFARKRSLALKMRRLIYLTVFNSVAWGPSHLSRDQTSYKCPRRGSPPSLGVGG